MESDEHLTNVGMLPVTIVIRAAEKDRDHHILCALAKRSEYIRSFSSIMFSSDAAYEKGWIRVAVRAETDEVVGFSCCRHKVRQPETMLYFLMAKPELQRAGIGRALIKDLEKKTPHDRIVLKVMKKNVGAIAFYKKLGYCIEREGEYGGQGLLMVKEW